MADTAPQAPFGNYQYEVYLKGMAGQAPDFPMSWTELEVQASAAMDAGANGYVFGSAGTEDTELENRAAFTRHRIVPRMLRDVSTRDLRTEMFGVQHAAPVLLAPVGVQSIVHPDGELAAARGAAEAGIGFVASTASSYSMEGIAAGGRRRAALVSAVLAQGPRPHRKLCRTRRGGRLRSTRRDAGHRPAGVASARLADRLPARRTAAHRNRARGQRRTQRSQVHRIVAAGWPDDDETDDDDDDDWPDDEDEELVEPVPLVEPVRYCGKETVILPQGRGEEPKRACAERWVDARGEQVNELHFYRYRCALDARGDLEAVKAFDADVDRQRREYEQRRRSPRRRGMGGRRWVNPSSPSAD